jgi:hypothetical protein
MLGIGDVLALSPGEGVLGDLLALVEDRELLLAEPDEDDLADEPVGNRVEVPPDADVAVLADLVSAEVAGLVGVQRKRSELLPLLGEQIYGPASRGSVEPHVRHVLPPAGEVGLGLLEDLEAPPAEAARLHVADVPLHLALVGRGVDPGGVRDDSVVPAETEEVLLVVALAQAVDQDRGAQVVRLEPGRDAAEVLESSPDGAEEGRDRLVEDELVVAHPGKAQRHHEEVDLPRLAVDEQFPDLAEVDLGLLSGSGAHPAVDHGLHFAELLHVPLHGGVGRIEVGKLQEILVDLDRRKPCLEHAFDETPPRIELLRDRSPGQRGVPGLEPADVLADGADVDAEASGDGLVGHAVLIERPDRQMGRH